MNRFVTPTRVGVVLAGVALAAVAVWAAAGKLPVSKSKAVAAVPAAAPACAHAASAECAAAMKSAKTAHDACPACPACPATRTKSATATTAQRTAKASLGSAGMVVAIDPETGAFGPPTPEQAAALGAYATSSVDASSGIQVLRNPNGSVIAVDHAGQFEQFYTVTVGPDGKLHAACTSRDGQATAHPAPPPAPAGEDK